MKNRLLSRSFLRIAAVCASLFACSNASAVLLLNLSFNSSTLEVNSTGTFTLSGSGTSTATSSASWQAYEPGATDGWFTFDALTLDTRGVTITNNGAVFTPNIVNTEIFNAGGGTTLIINGGSTQSNSTLQIGNGTTDFITGTFRIMNSPGPSVLSIADLNRTGTHYTVTASAVPEPSTYVIWAGAAVLGFVCIQRRRRQAK